MKTLHNLFLDQLADAYYAEKQLTKALPKIAKAAANADLREALESHLEETEDHVKRLESVFRVLDETPRAKKCHAILGLLKEGEEMIEEYKGTQSLDAAIIAAAQKVEHYEISNYGTLSEWASQLDRQDAVELLEEILEQEKAADATLSKLACESVNETAEGGEETDEKPDAKEPAARQSARSR